jgi:predicted ribosomally synthesized six-cysteine peptide SCIFF
MLYLIDNNNEEGDTYMKRIITLKSRNLNESLKKGGCGECQTSCQSACKTSCGVANQPCENKKEEK